MLTQRIRAKLTYANVVSTLGLFLVLGGGTALAARAIVASNGDVGPGTISGHRPPKGARANIIAGSINNADLGKGSVGSSEVRDGSLTPADLQNGVQAFQLGGPAGQFEGKRIPPVIIYSFCHSGGTALRIYPSGNVEGMLNWTYATGSAQVTSGSVVPASGFWEFDYQGGRIEGQFIYASGNEVATLNVHALDKGSSCETSGTVEFGTAAS